MNEARNASRETERSRRTGVSTWLPGRFRTTAARFGGGAAVFALLGTAVSLPATPPAMRPLFGLCGLLLGATLAGVAVWGPAMVGRYRRRQAIGAAPALVAFVIVHLELRPSLEAALDRVADALHGQLARSLATHRIAEPTGRRALEAFASEWADLDPSLRRSATLLRAATDIPDQERGAVLERALEIVLDGSRDRVARFGAAIRGPAMGIYAFGVMLPLALVGMLPVVASTGGAVPMVILVGLYDVLVPLGLLVASGWLAAKRPAVATQEVSPVVFAAAPEFRRTVPVGAGVAAVASVGAWLFVPGWAVPIVAAGTGVGAGLLYHLGPVRDRQSTLGSLDAGLPDALAIVGRRIADGQPVERTLGTVADRLSGPTGRLFQRADRRCDRLGTTVAGAFFGPMGALPSDASTRAGTTLELVAIAGDHGAPAGDTLQSVGQYLETLEQVEREARRELGQTTSTLRQTATLFAPAIAGATVAMATGMDAAEAPGQAVDVSILGTVIGVYVVLLAVILPSLSVVLERGLDPVRMGYRSGTALVSTGVVYPLAYLGASALVYI